VTSASFITGVRVIMSSILKCKMDLNQRNYLTNDSIHNVAIDTMTSHKIAVKWKLWHFTDAKIYTKRKMI